MVIRTSTMEISIMVKPVINPPELPMVFVEGKTGLRWVGRRII